MVAFLHSLELKASIMSKPHWKTRQTSKAFLFTWAEGQPDCCIAPFDPDHDSCRRMKVVDHRVPCHIELTDTPTQTNTTELEIGGWVCQSMVRTATIGSWRICWLKTELINSYVETSTLTNTNFLLNLLVCLMAFFRSQKPLCNNKFLLFQNNVIASGKCPHIYFTHLYFLGRHIQYTNRMFAMVAIWSRVQMSAVSRTSLSLVSCSANVSNVMKASSP